MGQLGVQEAVQRGRRTGRDFEMLQLRSAHSSEIVNAVNAVKISGLC